MTANSSSFSHRVPVLLVLVAIVGIGYAALLFFTTFLAPYRFPIPYAVPSSTSPSRSWPPASRISAWSATASVRTFSPRRSVLAVVAALLAIAHILTQPDYPLLRV